MRGVLIVDDHPIVQQVMRATARALFPDAVLDNADSLAAAIEIGQSEDFDLVVLDLGLPDASGLEVLAAFRAACPAPAVVVFSGIDDPRVMLAALQAGARGYVPKSSKPDLIAAALRLVASGGVYVPPQAIVGESAADTPRDLTERQLDVLRLMAKGLANKQIARQLRIAQDTVKNHAKALYAALGVQSRGEATRAAELRGIKLD